jgi:L-threonylcarbamoyladenylate synthase
MTTITWPFPSSGEAAAMDHLAAVLGAGGIAVFPTETVYGIGGIATDATVISRLYAIKGRSPDKPFPVLISSMAMLETLAAEIPPAARILMDRFWPGALTLVFRARPRTPTGCQSAAGTIAVRWSPHPLLCRIISRLEAPLIATSANLSGAAPPVNLGDVSNVVQRQADILIDGGRCTAGKPSTLVDVTLTPPRILRRGAIAAADLEPLLGAPRPDSSVAAVPSRTQVESR